jgi:hypothetical protein
MYAKTNFDMRIVLIFQAAEASEIESRDPRIGEKAELQSRY